MSNAIILCGGMATRLGKLAEDTPKVLMPVDGHSTILDLQIDLLKKHGVDRIVLAAGHLWEAIEQHLKSWKFRHNDIKIDFSVENKPLGTGGAFKYAYELNIKGQSFVGLNGDVYCPNLNIKSMIDQTDKSSEAACIAMKLYDIPFGTLSVYPSRNSNPGALHQITGFHEKKPIWINAGVYYIKPKLMEYKLGACSIEKDVFPNWANDLAGIGYRGPWFDMGTPETLEEAREFIKERKQ